MKKFDCFKNEKISDKLVNIIEKLTMNLYIPKEDINSLNDKEQILYNKLLKKVNLHKKNINDIDNIIIKLKNEYQLLIGEINAGNNNPEVIKDLKENLMNLYNLKCISKRQLYNQRKELDKIN